MTKHALIVSPTPFKFATRSRKGALAFAMIEEAEVTYLAPANVGRTGQWDKAGSWQVAGVSVNQVACPVPRTEPKVFNQILNLLLTYIPAFMRILVQALRTPADIVFINGPSLAIVGIAHKLLHRSTIVLDIPERPGVLAAKGSLATLIGRLDKVILKISAIFFEAATVVTYADVKYVKAVGFKSVHLVRNVPTKNWKAPFRLPPIGRINDDLPVLSILAMGSIFEGRGYENLIKAISIASQKFPVSLTICGPARESYKKQLKDLSLSLAVQDRVHFEEPVKPNQVSEMYLSSDLGMVLYESDDPGNDGLSNKLFECVASGRPVIASDLPENRRFITSENVGWLADTSPHGIATALGEAYNSGQIVQRSQYCRQVGESSLNWEDEFSSITQLLSAR